MGRRLYRVIRVERDAQGRNDGRPVVLWRTRTGLPEDRSVFEASGFERAQRVVHANRDQYIRRVEQPHGDAIYIPVLRDQPHRHCLLVGVPNRARRVGQGCDYDARHFIVQ
jgi:hypothetical protein